MDALPGTHQKMYPGLIQPWDEELGKLSSPVVMGLVVNRINYCGLTDNCIERSTKLTSGLRRTRYKGGV